MKPPSDAKPLKSADPWAPYVPGDRAPWNLRRVVHLHRRAGFAATWGEIQRDLKDGPQASLARVLAGKAATEGVPAEFGKTADLLGVGGRLGRSRTTQGVVDLPDDVRARPALRAAGAPVAQPFRHEQSQGAEPGAHAAAERVVPHARAAAVRGAAGRGRARPGAPGLAGCPE